MIYLSITQDYYSTGREGDQQDRVDQLVLEHAQEFWPLTTSIPFSLTATQINLWLYQINLWLYQIVCRPDQISLC